MPSQRRKIHTDVRKTNYKINYFTTLANSFKAGQINSRDIIFLVFSSVAFSSEEQNQQQQETNNCQKPLRWVLLCF